MFLIVDTNNYTSKCLIDSIEGRKIKLTNVLPSKTELKTNSNIVVLSIGYKFRKKLICFSFWCPENGSTLSIFYEVKRKKLDLLGYKIGDQ